MSDHSETQPAASGHSMFFQGRIAVITGGANGIGRATAEVLADLGAAVVLLDIDQSEGGRAEQDLTKRGARALFLETDITDPAAVQRAVDRTLAEFGRIDVLVNNAGSTGTMMGIANAPLWEMPVESIQRLLALNLGAVLWTARAVLPSMIERRSGAIVNIASAAGIIGIPNQTTYSAAKAGVVKLTTALAKEVGPHGIRVNCVAPGLTATRVWSHQLDGRTLDSAAQALSVPLGRAGQPIELARVIAFLASDLSSYVQGEVIPVDGGI